jgi:hypothetical protein
VAARLPEMLIFGFGLLGWRSDWRLFDRRLAGLMKIPVAA